MDVLYKEYDIPRHCVETKLLRLGFSKRPPIVFTVYAGSPDSVVFSESSIVVT
jgi:hypothetical protein